MNRTERHSIRKLKGEGVGTYNICHICHEAVTQSFYFRDSENKGALPSYKCQTQLAGFQAV